MAILYAELCQHCGEVRTRHASKLCSRCRRLRGPETHCRTCGARTHNGQEICWLCEAKSKAGPDDLEAVKAAIRRHQAALDVLRGKEAGAPFPEIAEQMGVPEITVRELYHQAMDRTPQ